MLDHRGIIELHHLMRRLPPGSTWIEVHDRETGVDKSISIDVGDSGADNFPARSSLADATWKRSFRSGPARPLGLVASMRCGRERFSRYLAAAVHAVRSRQPWGVRAVLWGLDPRRLPPLVDELEADPGGAERVLFQVRAWEPWQSRDPEHRWKVNADRAAIIRGLREAIGHRFVGGFIATPFARSTYPQLVSELPTDRRAYLGLVRESAIAVSTAGLQGSNPWKLSEYLASSRAIVTEPLHYQLPERLDAAAKFFDHPQRCVDRCIELLDSPDHRTELQEHARSYWLQNARPDRLFLRRLHEEFD